MSITATRRGPDIPTGATRPCARCGLEREVKAGHGDYCRDCRTMYHTRPAPPRAGELAYWSLRRAENLACLVRDEGRDAIGEFLDRLDHQGLYGLCVALAAMVPVDVPTSELVAWLDELVPAA